MSLVSNIISFLKGEKKEMKAPEGLCPNCWGRQEYGGAFYEAMKAHGINTNNLLEKKGWIQAYAEQHLTGIQLNKEDAKLICNNCKVNYTM